MQTQNRHSVADSFRGLAAAVISRALDDLEKDRSAIRTSDHVRDEALAWINGPECEAFCWALDMDYRAIRERGAALYRRFLEKAEKREKSVWKRYGEFSESYKKGNDRTVIGVGYGERKRRGNGEKQG
jgi:hypothetical protein